MEADSCLAREEKLREATCFGDEDAVRTLVAQGVDINAQHEINGWTALHWAAKRGHAAIAAFLLHRGADPSLLSRKGETPADLADDDEILRLLGVTRTPRRRNPLPITPAYMAYSPLNYKVEVGDLTASTSRPSLNGTIDSPRPQRKQSLHSTNEDSELVLKVRVAQSNDLDFIEVELPRNDLSYSRLLRICCEELAVDLKNVLKIRKLPDTIVRKDKDVRRLQELQELELVLTTRGPNGTISQSSALGFPPLPGFRNCTILY